MTFRYYKRPTSDQVFIEADFDEQWAVVGRSKDGPVGLNLGTLSGTKITRDEAVELVGEDHVMSAEASARFAS